MSDEEHSLIVRLHPDEVLDIIDDVTDRYAGNLFNPGRGLFFGSVGRYDFSLAIQRKWGRGRNNYAPFRLEGEVRPVRGGTEILYRINRNQVWFVFFIIGIVIVSIIFLVGLGMAVASIAAGTPEGLFCMFPPMLPAVAIILQFVFSNMEKDRLKRQFIDLFWEDILAEERFPPQEDY